MPGKELKITEVMLNGLPKKEFTKWKSNKPDESYQEPGLNEYPPMTIKAFNVELS